MRTFCVLFFSDYLVLFAHLRNVKFENVNGMKQIILFFMLLLPLSSFAQFTYDIKAGVNFSHFKSSQNTEEKQVGGMKTGFQIGVDVSYEFKRHWLLSSGLMFAQTRSTMNLTDGMTYGYFFPHTDVELNHLIIPLKVGYNVRFCEDFQLIPSVGWYGSIDFNAGKSSLAFFKEGGGWGYTTWKPMDGYTYVPPVSESQSYTATLSPFRHWTYGVMGGLKAVVCKHYIVNLDYYESIKKGQKQNDLRNYGLQLSVGYRF